MHFYECMASTGGPARLHIMAGIISLAIIISLAGKTRPHAGLIIRGPPAINQREQCILGVGGNSCLNMVDVLRPLLAEWAWVVISMGSR